MSTNYGKNKLEKLNGTVQSITYQHHETGFCVLRLKSQGLKQPIVLTGTLPQVREGELVEASGHWTIHKKHGRQFQAVTIQITPPTQLDGITKYLSSGLIKGIGKHFADKLVKTFGKGVFDVIENHPERLSTLPGIGKKRVAQIINAFRTQKKISQVMIFLQSYGIGSARAIRIYKTYGEESIEKIKENPYSLSQDIYGIGFKLADDVAQNLGVDKSALIRVKAGIHHLVQTLTQKGHCAIQYSELIKHANRLLAVETPLIVKAIHEETKDNKLIEDKIKGDRCIFTTALYQAELSIAQQIKRLQQGDLPWSGLNVEQALLWVESKMSFTLSESQRQAIKTVLSNKVSIITGGPGVGKTTITASILKIIQAKGMRIMLCAPTGRAAKRLSEATGRQAKTIHRLLEYTPQTRQFKYNAYNSLPADFIIIDEASMLDASLMYYLVRSMPLTAACVFIGDVNQLPSVGPGAVLKNLIDSKKITTVFLTEIFRQASASHIVLNAHRIHQGKMPENIPPVSNTLPDFYMMLVEDTTTIQRLIIELMQHRIPKRFGLHPIKDIQVLTPMHRSSLGSQTLNEQIQKALNTHQGSIIKSLGYTFSSGDKVIQQVNNYDKDVFNGDLGFIEKIDTQNERIFVQFDDRLIPYESNELNEISLAYAMSVHKSQGSEYPAVIIPLVTQHYIMLARNLLYTAVTRGKQLVILIGQKKAIKIAVQNQQVKERLTKLKHWMINKT